MMLKLATLFAGVLTFVIAAPSVAQGCDQGNRDNPDLPEQTQTSVMVEENTF